VPGALINERVADSNLSEWLGEFVQGHTEEIADPARGNETVLLIKPDCALQGDRRIEVDPCASAGKQILFSRKQ